MTTTTHIGGLDHSVDQTNIWLADTASQLGTADRREAYRVLRAFLHAIRDRLTVAEAVDLGAQLPIVLRGVYYQDWRPGRRVDARGDLDSFLRDFAREGRLSTECTVGFAAEAVLHVLRSHISDGEVDGVLTVLPSDVRNMLNGLTVHASS